MPTDTLQPEAVLPLLRTTFGRPYRYTSRCESTQELLDPDDPEGAVAVSEEQTAGRGRRGRAWSAPAGEAILCSVMLRPPPTRLAAQTSLLGGLAAARALSDASSCVVRIKWPNDVLVGRCKVAGVLAEATDGHVALGFGLNINQSLDSFPDDLRASAGSLRTLDGKSRLRAPILSGLLAALEDVYSAWSEGSPLSRTNWRTSTPYAGWRCRSGRWTGLLPASTPTAGCSLRATVHVSRSMPARSACRVLVGRVRAHREAPLLQALLPSALARSPGTLNRRLDLAGSLEKT